MAKATRMFYRANDFDHLHTLGAKRWGELWFTTNRTVINLARNYGIDATGQRAFLSDVAYEICRAAEKGHPPEGTVEDSPHAGGGA